MERMFLLPIYVSEYDWIPEVIILLTTPKQLYISSSIVSLPCQPTKQQISQSVTATSNEKLRGKGGGGGVVQRVHEFHVWHIRGLVILCSMYRRSKEGEVGKS